MADGGPWWGTIRQCRCQEAVGGGKVNNNDGDKDIDARSLNQLSRSEARAINARRQCADCQKGTD